MADQDQMTVALAALHARIDALLAQQQQHFLELASRFEGMNPTVLDQVEAFDVHHCAFHVSDDEFDAIFKRVQDAGIEWGSDPWSPTNRQLNSRKGGRGVYFRDLDGHMLELLTRP